MFEALLSPLGYTLTSALDGNEALHLIRSREYLPDLVILDVQMPGKTGYEVTRHLTPECPIFFISIRNRFIFKSDFNRFIFKSDFNRF